MLIAQCRQGLGLPRLRRDRRVVQRDECPFLGRDVLARERIGVGCRRRLRIGVVARGAGGHAGADEEGQGRSAGQA